MTPTRWIGLTAAAVVISLQWVIVAGFVAHAYTWWFKVHDSGIVSAGLAGTALLFVCSAAAISWAIRDYSRLPVRPSALRGVVLLIALAGLSGLLVLAGIVSAGIVLIAPR